MISILKKVTSLTISSVLLLSSLLSNAGFSYAAEEEVFYYLHDHLGSVEAVMDEDGNVVERRDYLPYGKTREEVIANTKHPELYENYGFTGKELDEETGLMYYGARYYSPVLGRFVTPDPVVFDEGKKSNTELKDILNDPQKLNPYTYANNNPLKYVDDTGGNRDYCRSNCYGRLYRRFFRELPKCCRTRY